MPPEPVLNADYVWPYCCTCTPGDGSETCPSEGRCFEAWQEFRASRRNLTSPHDANGDGEM